MTVTSKNASFAYYDIETLNNVFTLCLYVEKPANQLVVFYLIDENCNLYDQIYNRMNESEREYFFAKTLSEKIIKENPTFARRINGIANIKLLDLRRYEANLILAQTFGLCAGKVNQSVPGDRFTKIFPKFRLTCDTDEDYDPTFKDGFNAGDYYLSGYNSLKYDTTILALYLQEAFSFITPENIKDAEVQAILSDPNLNAAEKTKQASEYLLEKNNGFRPVKASILRAYNDKMFEPGNIDYMPKILNYHKTAKSIRNNMLASGRYLDVAALNEKQQKVALKRLLGMIGNQILESDKLSGHDVTINTLDEFMDLIAYNASDVIELGELFKQDAYCNIFDIKKSLLDMYPETIYNNIPGTQKPNINPNEVRWNRLLPDSSSAKFVTNILAPYDPLKDSEYVSFLYPHKDVAESLGIPQINLLENAKKFFYENVQDEDARREFDVVYKYYKSIEGKNFNSSETYSRYYQNDVFDLKDIPKLPTTIPYFDKDGNMTSSYITFSTGGIHGAEMNLAKYQNDYKVYKETAKLIEEAKSIFPDPIELRENKGFTNSEGEFIPFKEVLKGGKKIAESEYKDPQKIKPTLFKDKDSGDNTLDKKYNHTTVSQTIHEDFSSYYPNMLRNMKAFDNPALGEDRYAKLLADKDRYHKEMNAPGISPEEKEQLSIKRNAVKLLLNAASGAGDTNYESNIRMNNNIIAMRINGQLMTWEVGQTQTFAGGIMASTNTDGIYSILDEETNNTILKELEKKINVQIDPEPILLVSKDSNSRLELEKQGDDYKIVNASGGTLACYKGPNPTQSLSHPAIVDYLLAHYLKAVAINHVNKNQNDFQIDKPFDKDYGRMLLDKLISTPKETDEETHKHYVWLARMFQHIIVSRSSSLTFPFAADPIIDDIDPSNPNNLSNIRTLQHTNRTFVCKPGAFDGAVSLQAMGCWKVTAAMKKNRAKNGLQPIIIGDPILLEHMEKLGYTRDDSFDQTLTLLPSDEDLVIRNITNLSPLWHMRIDNRNLHTLSLHELKDIIDSLDLDTYVEMAEKSYEKNWMN